MRGNYHKEENCSYFMCIGYSIRVLIHFSHGKDKKKKMQDNSLSRKQRLTEHKIFSLHKQILKLTMQQDQRCIVFEGHQMEHRKHSI